MSHYGMTHRLRITAQFDVGFRLFYTKYKYFSSRKRCIVFLNIIINKSLIELIYKLSSFFSLYLKINFNTFKIGLSNTHMHYYK